MFFNIQRFSTHDGDGIRSILFLKGCSLSCPWCQNPESRSAKRSLFFDKRSCIDGCSLCSERCSGISRNLAESPSSEVTIDRKLISQSDLIALETVCPAQALSVVGKQVQVDELLASLLRDKPYFLQSNGGVTFSGGEPLVQASLVKELAERLKSENINTAIETCMAVPWKNIDQVLPYIDCWLTDLKHTNEEKFKLWTKGSLQRIKTNFERLSTKAKRIIIRVPVVPGFNDTDQELQSIIDFAASLKMCSELHLLPYHTLGANKYKLLGMPYECSNEPLNNPALLERAQAYAETNYQLTVTIKG